MPGQLRPLFAGTEAPAIKSSLFITIPGIGTPPVDQWRQGNTGPHWVRELSKDGLFYKWEHGLSANSSLSWQAISTSAIELLDGVIGLRKSLGKSCGPVMFLAHSLGGSILKQTLCLDSNNDTRNITDKLAGVVLVGCPHPKNLDEASQLCNRFRQAFVDKSLHTKAFPDDDPARILALSSRFDNLGDSLPLLTVYENQGTRLSWRRSKKLRIVHPTLAFVNNERRLPIDCSHRELCYIPINSPVHRSIWSFVKDAVLQRRAALDDNSLRRTDSCSPSLSYTIGTWDDSESGNPEVTSTYSTDPIIVSEDAEANAIDLPFQDLQIKLPYYHQIPTANPDFFARDEIFCALYDNLLSWRQNEVNKDVSRGGIRTFALCGDVGSGKTQIASQFVHNHKDKYDAILWLHAKEVTKLWTSYDEIATALGLQGSSKNHDVVASRDLVRDWLARSSRSVGRGTQSIQRMKWLLVFDNVDDPDILRDFWPEGGSGDVLITSRHPLTKTANFFGQMGIDVEPFDTSLAVKFLSQLTQRGLNEHQTLAAAQIAETLGGLPLGLVSASRLINEGFLTLGENGFNGIHYQSTSPLQLRELSTSPTNNPYDQVQSMILVLLEKLREGSALMDILALLDPDGVKESILIDGARHLRLRGFPRNSSSWHVAKAELIKASLVSQNQAGNEIYVHRWIQDIAKVRMGLGRLTEVYEATIDMFSSLWPRVPIVKRYSVSRWDACATLLPHVLRLHQFHEGNVQLDLSPRSSIQFAELMNEAAWSLYERGDFDNALSLSFQARAIGEVQMEDASSKDDPDFINLLSKIYYTFGTLCDVTNEKSEGFKAHEKFLALRNHLQHLQPKLLHEDELLAQAYNELANGYAAQKNYDDAEIHYRLSISVYNKLRQPNKLQLSLPYANLGLVLWLKGDLEAASALVAEALKDREKIFGPDDRDSMKTGRLLYAMGNIRFDQGRHGESMEYHQRAYHQLRETNGPSHHRTCDASCRLALHYARLNRPEDAIKHLDQALKVFLYRPWFKNEKARTSFQKGKLLESVGRHSEAKPYLREAGAIYRELCPEDPKKREDLTMKDFDELVMFWSR